MIVPCSAQTPDSSATSVNTKRVLIVSAANAALWSGSFIALNKAWYADYPKTGFHFFNDNSEWNQMDKAGHVWSAYQLSRASAEAWKWAGLDRNSSAILGAAGGIVYQGIIEIQDAYSAEWGFSWGDIASNVLGSGLYMAQEIGWKEQRLQIKMGYWPVRYPDALIPRRNQLFGSTAIERVLKDYNAQTYWLSANIASFFPSSDIPKWINISFGYGVNGIYGARSNTWLNNEGATVDRSDIRRARQYYLSPDIDLTRIKTNSKWLRSIFFVLNCVKVPAPAIELNNSGQVSFHLLK